MADEELVYTVNSPGVGPPFRRAIPKGRHSEKSAIPKAVIQGLPGIVLDIVSYYLAIGRFKGCKGAIL